MIPPLVLASASPRRAEILRQLGLDPEVHVADVDEAERPNETPEALVERLARSKAEAVAAERPDAIVVGGDTIVVDGERVLGKPTDVSDAVRMIRSLSGRTHLVLSGVAVVVDGRTYSAVAPTRVRFREVSEAAAKAYAETGEPLDKAGAYGIQGLGAALIEGIEGDFYTVMGFPVVTFVRLLGEAGYRYDFGEVVERSVPQEG